jgi:hypothetical protein
MVYLFQKYMRYINIDDFGEKLGRMKNVNLLSLYDCCREIPPTKSTADALLTKESDTSNYGMSHTFYAVQDGALAFAGHKYAENSPVTGNWLTFNNANPGSSYPSVLKEF